MYLTSLTEQGRNHIWGFILLSQKQKSYSTKLIEDTTKNNPMAILLGEKIV